MRSTSWVFWILFAACGVAFGADGKKSPDKLAQWSRVERVPVNALIEVEREGQAGVDECRIESVDDSALTCVAERPEGDMRIVFPQGSVEKVWVIEQVKDRHIGRWIVVGAGIALIVAACVEGGVIGFVTVGVLVLGVGTSYLEDTLWRQPPPTPRMRWRLIYSAP
ncbi:MAG TPA: hypothetical protein VNU92_08015 [Edaphobacter sp.]|jgi:hypothetical protein|nr:hypothetical protein [Edaphobacter sp.]